MAGAGMTHVTAVNRSSALALLSDGTVAIVTNWINDEGCECDAEAAIVCVVGPDPNGKWHSVDLRDFDPVVTQ